MHILLFFIFRLVVLMVLKVKPMMKYLDIQVRIYQVYVKGIQNRSSEVLPQAPSQGGAKPLEKLICKMLLINLRQSNSGTVPLGGG